jgi:hypothetical protein
VPEQLPVYQERRGWTARTIRALVIVVVVDLALAVLFAIAHGWLGMIFAAILLLGSIVVIDGGVRKPVALRVDENGIALTKSTARKPTVFVRWPELRAVWVVRQNRGTYAFGVTTEAAPDEPRRYFPMLDWHVDIDRLAETVARYAPTATIRNELPRRKATAPAREYL